ncbi:MAG: hypothetical protein AAFY06_06625 [Pseudomonadota bacterium]
MSRTHRIAGLRISRVATSVDSQARLPDLEPPEERLRRQKSTIFSADSIALSHVATMEDVFDQKQPEEQLDTVARATVYTLNLIVLILAMPIGVMLFFLNILGGENLRTTAHTIALVGLFSALANMEGALPILTIL